MRRFCVGKLTYRSHEMTYLVNFDELGLAIFDGLYVANAIRHF